MHPLGDLADIIGSIYDPVLAMPRPESMDEDLHRQLQKLARARAEWRASDHGSGMPRASAYRTKTGPSDADGS